MKKSDKQQRSKRARAERKRRPKSSKRSAERPRSSDTRRAPRRQSWPFDADVGDTGEHAELRLAAHYGLLVATGVVGLDEPVGAFDLIYTTARPGLIETHHRPSRTRTFPPLTSDIPMPRGADIELLAELEPGATIGVCAVTADAGWGGRFGVARVAGAVDGDGRVWGRIVLLTGGRDGQMHVEDLVQTRVRVDGGLAGAWNTLAVWQASMHEQAGDALTDRLKRH